MARSATSLTCGGVGSECERENAAWETQRAQAKGNESQRSY